MNTRIKIERLIRRLFDAASQALVDPRTGTLVGLAGLLVSVVQRC